MAEGSQRGSPPVPSAARVTFLYRYRGSVSAKSSYSPLAATPLADFWPRIALTCPQVSSIRSKLSETVRVI
jgi:hypothetical protein